MELSVDNTPLISRKMKENSDGNYLKKPAIKVATSEHAEIIGAINNTNNNTIPDLSNRISPQDLSDPLLAYPRISEPHNRTHPRGICLLLNQKNFDYQATGQQKRDGTDVDADSVERTFIKLGYFVNRATDLNLKKMILFMTDISSQDHSHFDSFVCVILSHGSEGEIFATDAPIPTKDIFALFRGDRCPSLVGKPKLFFIQACRGMEFDKGVRQMPDSAGDCLTYKLPIEADFFIANSTTDGYYAWRNVNTGSWFIRELCEVLRTAQCQVIADGSEFDVATLMTVVARKVAVLYESETDHSQSSKMKQMVSCVSNLTRRVFLTKRPPLPPSSA